MRFIIYKEEFLDGTRTTELPLAIYATEEEGIARPQFAILFAMEMNRWQNLFRDVTEERAPDLLVATADGGRRTLRMGLLDQFVRHFRGRHPPIWGRRDDLEPPQPEG